MQEAPFATRLSEAFRLEGAPAVETQDRRQAAIVAVQLRRDAPGLGMTRPMLAERAYLLLLHLADVDRFECWQDRRSPGPRRVKAGTCTLHDLHRSPSVCLDEAFHVVAIRLPDAVVHRSVVDATTRLDVAGIDIVDPVLAGLARSVVPFLDGSVARNPACIDHLLRAIGAQVSSLHEAAPAAVRTFRGGLAPWQQRRAQDLLRQHLAEGITLDEVAQACSLSSSGFVRAFRQSVGVPPHQWLLRCRVDRAAELMRDRRLSLSEIAVSSGFFDQSHFTRAFSQRMGLSPGAWRKAQAGFA